MCANQLAEPEEPEERLESIDWKANQSLVKYHNDRSNWDRLICRARPPLTGLPTRLPDNFTNKRARSRRNRVISSQVVSAGFQFEEEEPASKKEDAL